MISNACELIKVKEAFLDWKKKQEKKAEVQVAIKTILNEGLPDVYDKAILDTKRLML